MKGREGSILNASARVAELLKPPRYSFFFSGIMAHPFFVISLLSILLYFSSSADHVLYTDEVLMAGQSLTNGRHSLTVQPNCRLVVLNESAVVWSTNATARNTGCYVALTQHGQLVLRHSVHYALWSSGVRSKKGKYALVLDAGGRIAVYGHRRWSTTNPSGLNVEPGRVRGENVLESGRRMLEGERLRYGDYELAFWKCNLVINDTRTGRWLWQTHTKAATAAAKDPKCFLRLESSGELSLKNGSQQLWSSNKRTDSGRHVAILRFDARLAVYGPLIWANVRMDDSTSLPDDPPFIPSGLSAFL